MGFRVVRQGKHIVMSDGVRIVTIPRHNPVNASPWAVSFAMPDSAKTSSERCCRGAGMMIDIDRLTEAELVDLNNRIVERLRFLHQMRRHAQMLEFRIGDRVSFEPEGRPPVSGMLTRYNRHTVTVITDSGERWNVAPALLRRAGGSRRADGAAAADVIPLRPK
jgi:hypothetical protein